MSGPSAPPEKPGLSDTFYNDRFSMDLSTQKHSDLVAFLAAL